MIPLLSRRSIQTGANGPGTRSPNRESTKTMASGAAVSGSKSSNPTKPLDTHRLTAGASDVLAFLLSSCSATIHSAERIWLLHFTMGNIMKMLRYALTASALLALAPTAASAADFGPYGPGPYVERPVPTPPAYYVRPYYPQPYYDEAHYYGARFRRPYPYVAAYPYWRGPRFAYYGHRPYWRGHWGGRGRRW